MNKCSAEYNPDDLTYEGSVDEEKRIEELEREANKDIEVVGPVSTVTFPIKEFEGEFDETKMWELFQPEEQDHEERVVSQILAIKYALWYARQNNNTAKNFIIMVINNEDLVEDESVTEEAKNAFFLFISSFIRTEIEKLYRSHKVHFENDYKYGEAVREAMQYCWEPIMAGLPTYNPEKGAITTFLRHRIMEGYHSYESKRNQKSSKQMLSIDAQIVRARKSLEEKGMDTNPRLIELELQTINPKMAKNIGYQQIIASDERTKGEANSFSADDYSNEALYFNKQATQTRFKTPEEAVELGEKTSRIINALGELDDLSQYIFLADAGYEIAGGSIYECKSKSITTLSDELGLSADEIFKKKAKAIDHLKKSLSNTTEDNLLRGKELEFYGDMEDEDLIDFVNSIVTITDDDFKDFRE